MRIDCVNGTARGTITCTGPKQRHVRSRSRQRSRGATAVEMALVLPIILLMFFGCVELARLNFIFHTAGNAAFEGARAAIVPGGTAADAQQEAMQMLTTARVANGATVEVHEFPTRVTVDVTIPVASNAWGLGRFTGGLAVTGSATLNRETFTAAP